MTPAFQQAGEFSHAVFVADPQAPEALSMYGDMVNTERG